MLEKMKQLMEMQRKMQEVKRALDEVTFEIASPDGAVTIVMNGSQEVQGLTLREGFGDLDKSRLEKTLKDAYNSAIRRSHDLAAEKMKGIVGFDMPGL